MRYVLYVVLAIVLKMFNGGYDFNIYMRAVDRWLNGGCIYCEGFYYAPWFLPLLLPFRLLGYVGWATLSIAALFYIIEDVPVWAKFIAFFAPAIISDLGMGQINLLLLATLMYAERAGARGKYYQLGVCLTLLAIKPINVILPVALLLWRHRRYWPRITIIPVTVLGISLILWGMWPVDYLQNVGHINPAPIISVWGLGRLTGLVILCGILAAWHTWHKGDQLNATIVLNLTLSPYIVSTHLALLMSWIARLTTQHPLLAIVGLFLWYLLRMKR